MMHMISTTKGEQLQHYFTKVVEFPEDKMEEAQGKWEKLPVLAQSLGQRVPIDWSPRILRKGDVEAFSLAENYLLFRFKSEEEQDNILNEGPWIVVNQLLAGEPCVPDFVLRINIVKRTTVWLRLPSLTIKF